MSLKDIVQTIDFLEIKESQGEHERLSIISVDVLERFNGENLDTALSVLISSLEYLIRQLPPQDQNDTRIKVVAFIDKKSYTRQ